MALKKHKNGGLVFLSRIALATLFGPKLPASIEGALVRLLVLDRFHSFFEDLRQAGGGRSVLKRTLTALDVHPLISARISRWFPNKDRW